MSNKRRDLVFNYSDLKESEKKIIRLIGDNIKVPPIEAHTGIKNRKKLYEDYLKNLFSEEKFEECLTELYYKGLISFVPADIHMVDNQSLNYIEQLKNNYDKSVEKKWREQDPFVRLTVKGERTITGDMVLQQLIQEEMDEKYNNISNLVEDIEQKYIRVSSLVQNIEDKINNTQNKYIEMLAIFIAVFTIIISNTGIFIMLKETSFEEGVYITLLINGTILFAICFIILLLKGLILNQKLKFVHFLFFLFPVAILALGILAMRYPNYLLP